MPKVPLFVKGLLLGDNMDLTKFEGKYFGPSKIKTVECLSNRTYLGKKKVKIELENDICEEIPLEMLETCVTDNAIDLAELREKKVIPVVEKLIVLLTESELGNNDLHYAIDLKLTESIRMAADAAQEAIYGKPKDKITLMDLEKVLKKYTRKEKS